MRGEFLRAQQRHGRPEHSLTRSEKLYLGVWVGVTGCLGGGKEAILDTGVGSAPY
jgi:hypothetical protein